MAPYRYSIEWSGRYRPEWSDGDAQTLEDCNGKMLECFLSLRAKEKAILSVRVWTWDKAERKKKDAYYVDIDRLPENIRLVSGR